MAVTRVALDNLLSHALYCCVPGLSSPKRPLPAFSPSAAPASAPSALSADDPDDQEQQDRADRGINDLRDDPRTEMDSKLWKYPARNESPRYSHDEIADQTQARPHDDLARKPTSRDAHDQYDEKTLTGYVHIHVLTNELRNFRHCSE